MVHPFPSGGTPSSRQTRRQLVCMISGPLLRKKWSFLVNRCLMILVCRAVNIIIIRCDNLGGCSMINISPRNWKFSHGEWLPQRLVEHHVPLDCHGRCIICIGQGAFLVSLPLVALTVVSSQAHGVRRKGGVVSTDKGTRPGTNQLFHHLQVPVK